MCDFGEAASYIIAAQCSLVCSKTNFARCSLNVVSHKDQNSDQFSFVCTCCHVILYPYHCCYTEEETYFLINVNCFFHLLKVEICFSEVLLVVQRTEMFVVWPVRHRSVFIDASINLNGSTFLWTLQSSIWFLVCNPFNFPFKPHNNNVTKPATEPSDGGYLSLFTFNKKPC